MSIVWPQFVPDDGACNQSALVFTIVGYVDMYTCVTVQPCCFLGGSLAEMFTRVSVTHWKPPTHSQGNRWTSTITHKRTSPPLLHPQWELADIPPPRVRWPSQTPQSSSSSHSPAKYSRCFPLFSSPTSNSLTPHLSALSALSMPFTPNLVENMQRWGRRWRWTNAGRSREESGYEERDSSPSPILLRQDIDILIGTPGRPLRSGPPRHFHSESERAEPPEYCSQWQGSY